MLSYELLAAEFWTYRRKKPIGSQACALYFYLLNEASTQQGIDTSEFQVKNTIVASDLGVNDETLRTYRNQLYQAGVIEYTKGERKAKSPTYRILCPPFCPNNSGKTQGKTQGKTHDLVISNTIVNSSTIDNTVTNDRIIRVKQGVKNFGENPPNETLPSPTYTPPTETTLYYALNNQEKLIAGAQKMHYATASTNGVDELVSLVADYCRWYCGTYNTTMANANTSPAKAWSGFEEWLLKNPARAIHQGFLEYLSAKYQGKDIARAIEAAKLDAEAKATQIANWQAWVEKYVFGQNAPKYNTPNNNNSTATTNSNKLKRATPNAQ